MEIFWVLTYIDDEDQIYRQKFDNEDAARSAWYAADRPLFLDQVYRYESRI